MKPAVVTFAFHWGGGCHHDGACPWRPWPLCPGGHACGGPLHTQPPNMGQRLTHSQPGGVTDQQMWSLVGHAKKQMRAPMGH